MTLRPGDILSTGTPVGVGGFRKIFLKAGDRLRIEVEGARARLYVGNAPQPVLIVNDLKLGADASGGIALWVEEETDAHFADVRVTRRD